MRSPDLEGKVVVVTGGSRGIGRAIVQGAVDRGALVAYCHRGLGTTDTATVDYDRGYKEKRVVGVLADVTEEAGVEALFNAALNAFGQVDIAISNAGISRDSLLVSLAATEWDVVIRTNLTSAYLVASRAIREYLGAGTGGRIVSIGSPMQNGAPSNASYATSKGGLVGLTSWIARAFGDQGIYANIVAPGYVETALTERLPEEYKRAVINACPLKRGASAEEIASTALFLASARAAGLNGQVLYATGGMMEVFL